MDKLKIGYFSGGIRGFVCLEKLIKSDFDISFVLHNGKQNSIEHLENICIDNQIQIIVASTNSDIYNKVSDYQCNLFILSGFNSIISSKIINLPNLGTINLHSGKLPEYRGASVLNWQIINGEKQIELNIMWVTEEIDAGKVILKTSFDLLPSDNINTVVKKTTKQFPKLLINAIREICKNPNFGYLQDETKAAYYCKRYEKDGQVNWRMSSAENIHNLIRALKPPYPGAFSFYKNKKIVFDQSELISDNIFGIPGRIARRYKDGIVIIASDRGLLIKSIIFDGKIYNGKEIYKILSIGEDFDK